MVQAAVAAGPDWGEVIQLLALAVGTGVGAALGMRAALRPRRGGQTPSAEESPSEPPAPVWEPATQPLTSSRTAQAAGILFATAVGFGLIGFFCGALSGASLLLLLESAGFTAAGVAVTLANLVTGLIAGFVAGYLVQALGRRFQTLADELRGTRLRTAVVALAAGAVMGLLLGLLSNFGASGTLLALLGVGIVSAAASQAVPESRAGNPGEMPTAEPQS